MNEPLQDDSLALWLYVSKPPFESTELEFIGAVSNSRPSDIFHVAWGVNPLINVHQNIKLVIKGEQLENIKEIVEIKEENHITQQYAIKVAKHLYNYMESFNPNSNKNEVLNVPGDIFNKWYEKFSNKFKMDPNFVFNID